MSSTTPYSVRWRGPVLIPAGRAWGVAVAVETAGVSPTISAATFTLYDQGGVARIDAASASVSGGTISYTIPADTCTSADHGQGWLVKVEATIGGVDLPFYNDAAICLAPLYPPVGTSDLLSRYSKLADLNDENDDGTGAVDLQAYITDAWGELTQRMYQDGFPFWRVRSPAALRPWLLTQSLVYALDDLALLLAGENHYSSEARRLEASLEGMYAQIKTRLDPTEENTATVTNEGASAVLILSSGRRGRVYR